MTTLWEDVWDEVNRHFETVAKSLRAVNPDLWWSCGHSDNEFFPFRAHASFMKRWDPQESEDVVIALDAHKSTSGLRLTADISRGDGEMLAEGPHRELTLATDTRTLREEITSWVDSCIAFIDEHHELLLAELT
jgi:hypothetical protein